MTIEWSDSRLTKLRELNGKGLSTAAISRKMNISASAIGRKSHELGLPMREARGQNPKAVVRRVRPGTAIALPALASLR